MSTYIQLPNMSWKAPVANAGALPSDGNLTGDARVATATNTVYVWTGSAWVAVASPGAATAIDALTGDVSATGPGSVSSTVNAVGGSTASNVSLATVAANAATSANTVSTIVKRDSSGNFSAGAITASLSGNVTGNLTGNVTGNLSGNVTGNLTGSVTGAASLNVLKTGDTMSGTLNVRASTTAAGTAPIKIATGALMTSPEAGAIEYDGTNLYYTDSGNARRQLSYGSSGANTALSNLASVAINADLCTDSSTMLNLCTPNVSGLSQQANLFSGNSDTNDSGSVSINSGNADGAHSNSGRINIASGPVSSDGFSGGVQVATGQQNGSGPSGDLELLTGDNSGTGSSGDIRLKSGPTTAVGSISGDVIIGSGDSGDASGNVYLRSGIADVGASGHITISADDSDNGNTGNIYLVIGSAPNGSRGAVNINAPTIDCAGSPNASIVNVANPTTDQGVATKNYVDREGWEHYSASYTDFAVANFSHTFTIGTLGPYQFIDQVMLKHSTAFTGGIITEVQARVDIFAASAGSIFNTQAYDVHTAPSDINLSELNYAGYIFTYSGTTPIQLTLFTVGGGNLNALTQGAIDIYVKKSTWRQP